jgi:hypothetical protein
MAVWLSSNLSLYLMFVASIPLHAAADGMFVANVPQAPARSTMCGNKITNRRKEGPLGGVTKITNRRQEEPLGGVTNQDGEVVVAAVDEVVFDEHL